MPNNVIKFDANGLLEINGVKVGLGSVPVHDKGSWFGPLVVADNASTPDIPAINTIVLLPVPISRKADFDQIGVNVTTLEAAKLIQLAVYDDVDGEPSNLLLSTASQSLGATGDIAVAIAAADQDFDAGIVWLALNVDSTTAALEGVPDGGVVSMVGATTPGGILLPTHRTKAQTFATWPDPITATSLATGDIPLIRVRAKA